RAMGDAGIEADEYQSVLDMVAKAAQASGISVDTLADSITKYGAPMRAMGFEMKESIALFSQWEKSGVNTEIAFSGLKKAISNWGKAGKDPREEFKKTLAEIERTPDIASATSLAIEAFGAKAGPDLADAIKGGRFSYQEFLKTIEDSQGTVNQTFK
ncbi:phage tail tape measure protein, partial [Pseudomonas canadensis]